MWFSNASANHFTFGTPMGTASLTSMSGHAQGDTGYIASGAYTTLVLQNLDSLVILPLNPLNLPTFSQTSTVNSNRWCEVAFLWFTYLSGGNIAWQMSGGRDYHNNYHNLYFYLWSSTVFSKHNNISYTYGDHTTSISDNDTWHDITIDSCGQFMQGSFWNSSSNKLAPVDVFTNTTIYNIQDIATSLCCGNGQGTGIRGVFFQLTVHDCYITDRSGRGADGDDAWIYLTGGSFHAYNIIKWGGPGALARNNNPLMEVGFPWDNWVYNSGKFLGTMYGGLTFNAVPSDTVTGSTIGTDDYMWNFTLGDQINDTNGYYSPAILCGQSFGGGKTHHAWNIFGFNIGNNTQKVGFGPNHGVNQTWYNLGGWSPMDTSNGFYAKYGTLVNIDSTYVLYTNRTGSYSAFLLTASTPNTILNAGIVGHIVTPTADLKGSYPRNPPDLGYLQLLLTNLCNCHPRVTSGNKTNVISH